MNNEHSKHELNIPPPRVASWLLGWLVFDHFDTHAGDFQEYYNLLVKEKGRRRANWWYRGQVLRLIPDQLHEKAYWSLLMAKSYLLVGIRNLKKNKIPATINVVGLSAAIGSAIALFLFIYGVNTRDNFHENLDNLYLIGHTTEALETLPGMNQKWGTSPVPMGPALAEAYPQINHFVRYSEQGASIQAEGIAFRERVSFADTGFFDLFRGNERIVHDHLHFQAPGAIGNNGANLSHADYSQDLVEYFPALKFFLFPATGL